MTLDDDPYAGKVKLGQLVREAAKAAIYDEVEMPDVKRVNDIQVGEAFVSSLADGGCMITRIPRPSVEAGVQHDGDPA